MHIYPFVIRLDYFYSVMIFKNLLKKELKSTNHYTEKLSTDGHWGILPL